MMTTMFKIIEIIEDDIKNDSIAGEPFELFLGDLALEGRMESNMLEQRWTVGWIVSFGTGQTCFTLHIYST